MGFAAEFFPLPTAEAPISRPCACARYIGEFGAAPVERGYWFREEKVGNTRARIDALCGDIYQRQGRRRSSEEGEAGEEDAFDRCARVCVCVFVGFLSWM